MDKEKLQHLEWIVQFANMDNVFDLKPGDKAKLIIEAEEYLFDIKEWESINFLDQNDKEEFSHYQAEAKLKLPQKDSDEYWDLLDTIHNLVNQNLSMIINAFVPGRPNFFPLTQYGWDASIDPNPNIVVLLCSDGNKFRLMSFVENQSPAEYVLRKLFDIFNGLPLTTLNQCPGCNRFFVNFSQREKRFCSSKCMWRINAEERRRELKKNPKKYKEYLKKQKEIMRRKYEEKRKAQLGTNVKIKKRKGV